jgi:hydrogenase maturation factor
VSIIAREASLGLDLDGRDTRRGSAIIFDPGISVLKEAGIARDHGGVTAHARPPPRGDRHRVKELAMASGCGIEVYREKFLSFLLPQEYFPGFPRPLRRAGLGLLWWSAAKRNAHKASSRHGRHGGIEGSIIGRITEKKELVLARTAAGLLTGVRRRRDHQDLPFVKNRAR